MLDTSAVKILSFYVPTGLPHNPHNPSAMSSRPEGAAKKTRHPSQEGGGGGGGGGAKEDEPVWEPFPDHDPAFFNGGTDFTLAHDLEFTHRMSLREGQEHHTSTLVCDEKGCDKPFYCMNKDGDAMCEPCAQKNHWVPREYEGLGPSWVWDLKEGVEEPMPDIAPRGDGDTTLMGQTYRVFGVAFNVYDPAHGLIVQVDLDIGFDVVLKPKVALHKLRQPDGPESTHATHAFFERFQYTTGSFQIVCRNEHGMYEGLLCMDGVNINETLVETGLVEKS